MSGCTNTADAFYSSHGVRVAGTNKKACKTIGGNKAPHPLTKYVKLQVAHAPGMPGTFSAPPTSKGILVSDSSVQHGACSNLVPWCISGLQTRGGGKPFPVFPVRAQSAILRFLQEAYGHDVLKVSWQQCDKILIAGKCVVRSWVFS